MSDAMWHSLLQQVLFQYVTLLTNPEGPAPSAPTLTRKEIIERVTARKEACPAAISAAAAAAADGSDNGGDSDCCGDGGCDANCEDAALGHVGENEAAQPAAAKAAAAPAGRRWPK